MYTTTRQPTNLFPPTRPTLIKAASFHSISRESPYWFGNLVHLYLELSLGLDLEGAESVANARKAHEYIRKAADASYLAAGQFDGEVLEIHGRTIHVGLRYESPSDVEGQLKGFAGLLHELLKRAYGSGGPSGWRIAADHDATLTITSVGIHDDTSLVSMSPAANFPAKQLGKGLVPLWQLGSKIHEKWSCENLDDISASYSSFETAKTQTANDLTLLEAVMEKQARAVNLSSLSSVRQINCQAAPLGTPTGEDLYSCLGFVMSMDLDGFTKRVTEVANGTLEEQRQLAEDFLEIMEKTKKFAENHPDWFIQFPFAGDNAIFAVTAELADDFVALKKVTPVSVAVAWENEMGDLSREAGFGGWGQAAAGGETPHGNCKGNLHVSGIVLGDRRFLVGIGPGMRHVRQAFVQVDPSPTEIAMYRPNVSELHPRLRMEFLDCPSRLADTSSNFKMAELRDLKTALKDVEAEQQRKIASATPATIPLKNISITHRPHASLD
ncbi:MAG: hypothetical protein ABJQ29_08745 [Luteolibacter sp.]